MNKEQTLEAIKVMQAYVDGEEIESSIHGCVWMEHAEPEWNWTKCNYRIKPKPVEFKVWYSPSAFVCPIENHMDAVVAKQQGYRLITVRGVV